MNRCNSFTSYALSYAIYLVKANTIIIQKNIMDLRNQISSNQPNPQVPGMPPMGPEAFYNIFPSFRSLGLLPLPYDSAFASSMFPPQQQQPFQMPPMMSTPQPVQPSSIPPVSIPQQSPVRENGGRSSRKAREDPDAGRLYKCSKCDKTYLSYPALYTHTKLKHLQPGETPSITNGRMRGRPRKNLVFPQRGSYVDHQRRRAARPHHAALLSLGR